MGQMVSKKHFADVCGVGAPQITKLTRPGKRLADAVVAGKVDMDSEAARAYMADRGVSRSVPVIGGAAPKGKRGRKASEDDPTSDDFQSRYPDVRGLDIDKLKRLPMEDVVRGWGTDASLDGYVTVVEKLERISERRDKTSSNRGDLVSRSLVESVFDVYDAQNGRMLTDFPLKMASIVCANLGCPDKREIVEAVIRKEVEKEAARVKTESRRAIRKLQPKKRRRRGLAA